MNVNIYKIGGAAISVSSVDAMYAGVSKDTDANVQIIDILNKTHNPVYHPADVHILYGTYKPQLGTPSTVIKSQIIAGTVLCNTKFIQMETPLFGRVPNDNPNDLSTWPGLRVGIGHICNNYGNFGVPEKADGTRWSRMNRKLGINVKTWRKSGDYILIPLQMPFDAAMMGVNMWEWALKCIEDIRAVTDMPIYLKMHPKLREGQFHKVEKDQFVKATGRYSDVLFMKQETTAAASLSRAWAVVSFTSGFSVDAVLAGVPVIATSPGNFTYDISSHSCSDVLNPKMGDRLDWLKRYSYIQWDLNEMINGKAWKHIKAHL